MIDFALEDAAVLETGRPTSSVIGTESFEFPRGSVKEYVPVSVQGWMIILLCLDLLGSWILANLIFSIYAAPLDYERSQLWTGECGFIVLWVFAAQAQGLYTRGTLLAALRVQLMRATTAYALAFGLLLLLAFGFKEIGGVSRVWLLAWAGSTYVVIVTMRVLWRLWLQRQFRYGACLERALVLGVGPNAAERIGARVERESEGLIRVAASAAIPGTPDGASLAWLEATIRSNLVDRVIIANFDSALAQTNALLQRLARLSINVTVLPSFEGLQAPVLRADRIGMLVAVDIDSRPLSALQTYTKRLEDALISGVALLLLSPLLLLVSLAIKIDTPGPVFFRQRRSGFHDNSFMVWKFRTMHNGARDDRSVRQTTRGDARVTQVGRVLRRTSLDELPQLFNVLLGEMSIVGPRPHALGMTTVGLPLHEILEEYSARHRIKPGITGWAQINGCRGQVDTQEKLRKRVALDCYYIEHWSLGFDAWIILRTAASILFDRHAY